MKRPVEKGFLPGDSRSYRRPLLTPGVVVASLCALCACGVSLSPARPALAQRSSRTAEFVPTFSTNARVKQQIDRMGKLAAAKSWDPWIAEYQQLVDDTRDLVLERDEEFLVGVRYHCHTLLAGLPAAVRQRYRALHDGDARRLFEKALAESDEAGMREVYSRYRYSSFADRALLWIANRSLDAGRAEMARAAYSRLAKDPAVTAGTLLRYATAADLAGKPAEARAVLDRVRKDFAQQPVQLGGQETTGAAAADTLGKSLRPEAAAPGRRWTAFAGDTGDRKMPASLTGEVKRLWEFDYPTRPDSPRSSYERVQIGSFSSLGKGRFVYLTFPVLQGDRLWVQGPRNLSGLNLTTGQALWDRQGYVLTPEEAAVPQAVENHRGRGSYTYRGIRAVQGGPAVEGHLMVARMPLQGTETQGNAWPIDFAMVMVDTRDGRQLWRQIGGGNPKNVYYNLPALQSNTVLTGTAAVKGGITEYSATALDAGTGKELWTTYLGAGSDLFNGTDGSPAAVRDGIVWIESSLYTLNALDLITGEVRLVYRYKPERRPAYRGGFDSSPQLTNEPISLIAAGAGPIVFAPRWGVDVVALDPSANGKLLWSSPKSPGPSSMGSLFASDGKLAYVCGDYIQAINLADGAREWVADFNTVSSSVGFAALAGDRIYVPVEGNIHVLAAATGKELEVLKTGDVLGDSAGFCAVTPLDGMLLVTTHEKIVAFGPK